jgi:peroxiredoxin
VQNSDRLCKEISLGMLLLLLGRPIYRARGNGTLEAGEDSLIDPATQSTTAEPLPEDGQKGPRRLRGRPSLWRPAVLLVVLAVIIVLGSRTPHSSTGPTNTHPALAALVGTIPVPLADYTWQLAVATRSYSGPTAPADSPTGRTIARLLQDEAVQEAIAETLIDHEAALHHLTVSNADVSKSVAQLAGQTGGMVGLTHQLTTAGMTLNDLRRVTRHMILRDRLAKLLGDPAWLDHLVGKSQITYYVGDGAAGPDNVPAVLLGHPIPPFVAVNTAGKAVSPADFQGRPLVLMFWDTSCYDCVDGLTMLSAFSRAHPNFAVVVLDRGEKASTIRSYLKNLHVDNLTVWLDQAGTAAANYTVSSLPATFFIDAKGNMRGYNFGPIADIQSLKNQASFADRGVNDTSP